MVTGRNVLFSVLAVGLCFRTASGNLQTESGVEYGNQNKSPRPALVRLHQDMLSDYVKVRPRRNSSHPVDIHVKFDISTLLDLDGREGSITVYGFLSLEWTDEFLVWDPNLYDNTDEINFPITDIWRPDVGVFNSLSHMMGDVFRAMKEFPAVVSSDGAVFWGYNALLEATCQIDMTLFPFDRQTCYIIYSTLTSSRKFIRFTTVPFVSPIYATFMENDQFEIVSNSSSVVVFMFEGTEYPSLHLNFTIKRRPRFYFLNLIVPCLTLLLLGLLAFCLPVESGERVSLQVTTMLSFSIYQMKLMEYIPSNSPIPVLSVIILCLMVLSGISLAANVLVLHVYGRDPTTGISPALHEFLFRFLGKIVRYDIKCVDGDPPDSLASSTATDMERRASDSVLSQCNHIKGVPSVLRCCYDKTKYQITVVSRPKMGTWYAAAIILNRLFLGILVIVFLSIGVYCVGYAYV